MVWQGSRLDRSGGRATLPAAEQWLQGEVGRRLASRRREVQAVVEAGQWCGAREGVRCERSCGLSAPKLYGSVIFL